MVAHSLNRLAQNTQVDASQTSEEESDRSQATGRPPIVPTEPEGNENQVGCVAFHRGNCMCKYM